MESCLNIEGYYKSIITRDCNGQLYYGVITTGIYCKSVCRAKKPLLENTRFFFSYALAESEGYRPCLKCKPNIQDSKDCISNSLVEKTKKIIKAEFLTEHSLEDLARYLGITTRHLRRLFKKATGISPIQYAQNYRLLKASQLIKTTSLSITQIAFESGFGSIRQFNNLFKRKYLLNPKNFS